MSTSIAELDADQAEAAGFATFNRNGKHVCLDLGQESVTISVKTADDELVTFAFVERRNGEGHQCVDVQHHKGGTPTVVTVKL